jgi:hypothetical protein
MTNTAADTRQPTSSGASEPPKSVTQSSVKYPTIVAASLRMNAMSILPQFLPVFRRTDNDPNWTQWTLQTQ